MIYNYIHIISPLILGMRNLILIYQIYRKFEKNTYRTISLITPAG
jgi:hypothetical protein